MPKTHEIRGGKIDGILGWCIGWICRTWCMTYRLKVRDYAGVTQAQRDSPVIYLVWHNRLFASFPLWKVTCGHVPTVALMSASKDGSILAAAVTAAGGEVARGSSSRRGAAALLLLCKALRAKKDVYITPDGPRGPKYELQVGALKLAQREEVPIVVKHVKMADYWSLKSWDHFRIPKPCSNIELTYDAPISVPKDLTDDELEKLRLKIQTQMSRDN